MFIKTMFPHPLFRSIFRVTNVTLNGNTKMVNQHMLQQFYSITDYSKSTFPSESATMYVTLEGFRLFYKIGF